MFNVRRYNSVKELNDILNSIQPDVEEVITYTHGYLLTRFI